MTTLQNQDALLVVDVQVDFCPGGALPVEDGDAVVAVLNAWIDEAVAAEAVIVASRDWHPRQHLSFDAAGGEWPPHCVQDTPGAGFHPQLRLPATTVVVTKGTRFDQDQYSAFEQTGLAAELRRRGVRRVWIGGLAQDVCIRATALDGVELGFDVHLLVDATRPVARDSGLAALAAMRAAGIRLVGSS